MTSTIDAYSMRGEASPQPEPALEQTQDGGGHQRPAEQPGQRIESDERDGRVRQPPHHGMQHGEPAKAERYREGADHVDAEETPYPPDQARHRGDPAGQR